MPSKVAEIISKLLQPDNASIQEGTKELGEALKSPEILAELCQVMSENPTPQVRQYAAVILRKRLGKLKYWSKLDINAKNIIKEGVLQTLIREPEENIKNAVAQLVGSIAKHELPSGCWPNLLQFLLQLLQSQNPQERQLGVFVVSVVSGIAADQLATHLTQFLHLFPNHLAENNLSTAFYTIQALINFAPIVGQDHMEAYQKLLPSTVEVIKTLIQQDEEKAAQAMDLFDVLAECEVALLVPQLRPVVQLCLDISSNTNLSNSLRTKAISFLGYITRLKKKYLVKNKMSESIIRVLYNILCEKGEEDDAALGFLGGEDSEGGSPIHAAAQSIDSCALHLPPDKILPIVLSMIETSFKSEDTLQVKGAYLSLAMIAEGCADTLRTKHLHQLLQCISRGITSEHQVVKNSALFALGQFAEHLQPDISKYHTELLPVLFNFLGEVCNLAKSGTEDPPGVDRMFYALEVFCEHLEEEILPHLPPLMECLLSILSTPTSIHMQELAISAIGATATAAKGEMAPYFEKIVALLRGYLTEDQPEEKLTLQVQSLDTLSQLSRSMGPEHFTKYAPDCCALGLGLLEKKDDPDVRQTCYLLFASLASVIKEELSPHLPKLIDYMITSLRSSDGVVTHLKDGDTAIPVTIEGLSGSESDADEDNILDLDGKKDETEEEDIAGYSVENSYMSEKEDTCVAFKELALHCGDSFIIFLDRVAEEVYKMLNYPHEDVRQAAVGAMAQFAVTLAKSSHACAQEGFAKWVQIVIPKLSELIRTDEEYGVVMGGLEGFAELLREAGPAVLQYPGHLQAIINCVTDVMTSKTVCQDMADEETGSDIDGEAEQDEMLIEYAGEVVPNLGKALGPEEFARHFRNLFPLFANKMKKSCSLAERSFSVGTLAEAVEALGTSTGQFLGQLLPLFLQAAQDEDDEVRSNALYGLGVLGQHGGEPILEHYPMLLTALSNALSKESFPRALDNISGAVARLIMTNPSRVPMEQVFPVLLRCLPLREDFEENKTIFKCLLTLLQLKHPVFMNHLHPVLRLSTIVFNTKQSDQETNSTIHNLIVEVKREAPAEFEAFMQSLEPEWKERIQLILGSTS